MSLASLAKKYQNIDRLVPARWRLPLRYRAQSILGVLEPEIDLLHSILHGAAGTVALDVGANIGIYSYVLHRLGLQVHAFEPQPACAAIISAWAENKQGLTVHTAAIGAAPGQLVLHTPIVDGKPVPTRASFLPFNGPGLQMKVPIVTLDSLAARSVSFIKIDVEGYEFEVLKGATVLLDEYRPILLIEIDRARHTIESHSAIMDLLGAKGYSCYARHEGAKLTRCPRTWEAPPHVYNFIFSTQPLG